MLQQLRPEYTKDITEEYMTVTPAGQAQLAKIMRDADEEFTALRVFVEGGGCNGLTYGIAYVEEPTEHDSVLQCLDFRLVVDAVALTPTGRRNRLRQAGSQRGLCLQQRLSGCWWQRYV